MNWISGEVMGNELLGEKYRWLKIEPEKEVAQEVGQYFILKINERQQNSYSICSRPGSETLEAIVDVGPATLPGGGAGSRYIDGLKKGDRVRLAAPFGRFVLKDDGTATKVFVATGSGISSIFPMVWAASQDRLVSTRFFWGLRSEKNLFWQDRLAELGETRPNFWWEMVLSQPEGDWEGLTGHVTEHVEGWLAGFLNGGGTTKEVSFYVCGNGEMTRGVQGMLEEMGLEKERIYWEKYFEGEEPSDGH